MTETDASDAPEEADEETEAPAAAPKSKTHVSAKELKSVKVTDDEIEAELDEILADAEAGSDSDAESYSDAGSDSDAAPAEADGDQ